jgi:hypothetical protein
MDLAWLCGCKFFDVFPPQSMLRNIVIHITTTILSLARIADFQLFWGHEGPKAVPGPAQSRNGFFLST